jgi:hypothetical protein
MLTNDQIIEMAMQSGFGPAAAWEEINGPIIAFARLIQQAQREEDAVICESVHDWTLIERLTVMKDCAAAIRNSGGEK